MHVPAHFSVDDGTINELLTDHGAADLITPTAHGLIATMLPFIHDPEVGEHGALSGHLARNNPHWSEPATGESLVIIRGSDAYVSPSWYATKAKHGRVVPTWNYLTAHIYGRLVVHDDAEWVEALVRRITEKHEAKFPSPWSVDDAPNKYIGDHLRAIVGVELQITRIEAKAKLSQNRSGADVQGVIAGLSARGDEAAALAVERARR